MKINKTKKPEPKTEHKYMWMIVAIVCVVGVVGILLFFAGYTGVAGEAYKSVAGEKKAVAQTPYAKLSTAMNSYFGNIGRTVNVDTIIKSSNALLAMAVTDTSKYGKLYSNMHKGTASVAAVVNKILAGESDENINMLAALIGVEISTLKANYYGMGNAAYTTTKPLDPSKLALADKVAAVKDASIALKGAHQKITELQKESAAQEIMQQAGQALGGGGAPPAESGPNLPQDSGSPLQQIIDCVEALAGGAMQGGEPPMAGGATAGGPMPTGGVVAITGRGFYTGGGSGGSAPIDYTETYGLGGGGGPGVSECMGLQPGVGGGDVSQDASGEQGVDEGVDASVDLKAPKESGHDEPTTIEVAAEQNPASGEVEVLAATKVTNPGKANEKMEDMSIGSLGLSPTMSTTEYKSWQKEMTGKGYKVSGPGVKLSGKTGYDIEGGGSSNPCGDLTAAIDTCFGYGGDDEEDWCKSNVLIVAMVNPDAPGTVCGSPEGAGELIPGMFGEYYTDPMQFLTNAMTNLKSSSTLANYALGGETTTMTDEMVSLGDKSLGDK